MTKVSISFIMGIISGVYIASITDISRGFFLNIIICMTRGVYTVSMICMAGGGQKAIIKGMTSSRILGMARGVHIGCLYSYYSWHDQ
jgi:hypothetical protein